MKSNEIVNYLNDKVVGNETDYDIVWEQGFYGITTIKIINKELPCGCCKTLKKREKLISKRWTDGQGLKREARMCTECSAIAQDLYGI